MSSNRAPETAAVLTPADGRWSAALAEMPHDFYHTPAYLELEARRLGGRPIALLVEDAPMKVLLPLVVREFEVDGFPSERILDATSPYGYCPPLFTNPEGADPDRVLAALRRATERLADLGVCSAFVRLHPLLPTPIEWTSAPGRIVTHGETVYVDLRLSDEEIWHQTRPSDRTNIRKLERNGFEAFLDSDWERLPDFLRVYRETMSWVEASESYFFEDAYFEGLRTALADGIRLIVVRCGDDVAAAGLFTECAGIAQFHLSGTASAYRRAGPSRLMLEFARNWAKSRGNRALHLGGGVGGARDSLFEFKAGFSKLRGEFATWRVVTREEPYAAAVDVWERRHGVRADSLEGHFPAYRKPPALPTGGDRG